MVWGLKLAADAVVARAGGRRHAGECGDAEGGEGAQEPEEVF